MNKSYCNLTLFIHSSVVGHLGCFQPLIVVNDAAMSIRHVSFQISVCFFFFSFLDLYPGVELPGHIVVLFLVIIFFGGGALCYFPQWLHQYIPSECLRVPFLHIPVIFVICILLMVSILIGVTWYLIWISLMISNVLYACWQSAFPLWKNVYLVLRPDF